MLREKIDLIGLRDINWLKNRMKEIIKFEISKNLSEWDNLKEFYNLRNEIVHNQSLMPEKYDENIQLIDEDRNKIRLDYKSLKKYGTSIINYFNS